MMLSSSLSLYANATNKNNHQNNTEQPEESFSEQIVNLNKAIRTEYIRLLEQQSTHVSNQSRKSVKHLPKSPKKKSD